MAANPPPKIFAPTPVHISGAVGLVVQTLQQLQSQPLPAPGGTPTGQLVATEILGQDPHLRRPLGPASQAVRNAWNQAIQAMPAGQRYSVERGNGQSAAPTKPLPISPAVRVTDVFGSPMPNVDVAFVVTGGGGTVQAGAGRTDANGVASPVVWTLGAVQGLNTLVAKVSGATIVRFWAIAV